MSEKKVLRPLSEDEVAEMDHGHMLFVAMTQGTQIADEELSERIESIRNYLWDVLGRMSSVFVHDDDEEAIDDLINWSRYAFHYRQALSVSLADMKGLEVPDEFRDRWPMPFDAEIFSEVIERYRAAREEDVVH